MQKIPNPAYVPPTGTPRAVEVTGMFGDSVVTVAHLAPEPLPASSRRATRAIIASAIVMLAVSAFAFSRSVLTARDNAAALARHTEADRPLYQFRPEQLSVGYDVMAFGGLGLGLLAMGWALARRRAVHRTEFSLGRAAGVDFETDSAPADRFPLVQSSPQGPIVRVGDGMVAEVVDGEGKASALAELAERGDAIMSTEAGGGWELPIPEAGRIRIDSGLARFFVRWVPAPRRQSHSVMSRIETRMMWMFAASGLAHLAVLALIWGIPDARRGASVETQFDSPRYVSLTSMPLENPIEEQPDNHGAGELAKGEKPGEISGTGSLGNTGTPEETNTVGRLAVKNRGVPPRLARSADEHRAMARKAGILGYFATERDIFASLDSPYASSSGWDQEDVAGGYNGDRIEAINGPGGDWGNQIQSFSNSPYYRPGIYRTIDGYDTGDPNGKWWGPSRLPGKKGNDRERKGPKVSFCTGPNPCSTIGDGIDKETVRRYIKRQLGRIQHCYERALIADPSLAGTVSTAFTISPTGTVQGTSARGMNSTMQSCVSGVISSIHFPSSTDRSPVRVTYPFHFRQNGT